jgi:hypothetical protein
MLISKRLECDGVQFQPGGDSEISCSWPPKFSTYLVHGHQQTERTDTKASNKTTHHDLVPFICGGDLHNNAHANNGAPERNAVSAPNLVCNWGSDKSTEQRSNGQQSNDETRAHIGEVVCTVRVSLTKATHKVRHAEEAGNLTSILYARGQISVCIEHSSQVQAYVAEDTTTCIC